MRPVWPESIPGIVPVAPSALGPRFGPSGSRVYEDAAGVDSRRTADPCRSRLPRRRPCSSTPRAARATSLADSRSPFALEGRGADEAPEFNRETKPMNPELQPMVVRRGSPAASLAVYARSEWRADVAWLVVQAERWADRQKAAERARRRAEAALTPKPRRWARWIGAARAEPVVVAQPPPRHRRPAPPSPTVRVLPPLAVFG